MILIKYPPGALGHFFSSVLINLKKNSNFLDYGENRFSDILHIGEDKDDKRNLHTKLRIGKKDYKIINCNSAFSINFLENFYKNNYQIIF